jgi:hypothetical protein
MNLAAKASRHASTQVHSRFRTIAPGRSLRFKPTRSPTQSHRSKGAGETVPALQCSLTSPSDRRRSSISPSLNSLDSRRVARASCAAGRPLEPAAAAGVGRRLVAVGRAVSASEHRRLPLCWTELVDGSPDGSVPASEMGLGLPSGKAMLPINNAGTGRTGAQISRRENSGGCGSVPIALGKANG